MKSLFPRSAKCVETLRLSEDRQCDVYVWTSPEGVKIATHMIMPCPSCGYPLSLSTSEFEFEEKTLGHKIKCPARWKKSYSETVDGKIVRMVELNEKGKAIVQKCNWSGYILHGEIVPYHSKG